jgi:hypothetical protein
MIARILSDDPPCLLSSEIQGSLELRQQGGADSFNHGTVEKGTAKEWMS